jgi:hypothetical protein
MAERASFDTTEEIHAELQEVIDTSHLRTSRDARNHGKHAGIAVYMPKGTILKEMVETGTVRNFFLWSNSPNFWVAPHIYLISEIVCMYTSTSVYGATVV